MPRKLVYYGDISNEFLSRRAHEEPYDECGDLNDRKCCLNRLKKYPRKQFLGNEGKIEYRALPGRASWSDGLHPHSNRPAAVLGPAGSVSCANAPGAGGASGRPG